MHGARILLLHSKMSHVSPGYIITLHTVQGPAYYDYTTNYCNMRNLMVGAGLAGLQGYREESSVDLCMQFDRIEEFGNCNKY